MIEIELLFIIILICWTNTRLYYIEKKIKQFYDGLKEMNK